MTPLTPTQARILDFLERRQIPPTLRELCAFLNATGTNGASEHIQRLAVKGRVSLGPPGASRATVVVRPLSPEERQVFGLPATVCPGCGRIVQETGPEALAQLPEWA